VLQHVVFLVQLPYLGSGGINIGNDVHAAPLGLGGRVSFRLSFLHVFFSL
jgi:hypothetical protein